MTKKVLQWLLFGLGWFILPILAATSLVWTSNVLLGLDWDESSRCGLLGICYFTGTMASIPIAVEISNQW